MELKNSTRPELQPMTYVDVWSYACKATAMVDHPTCLARVHLCSSALVLLHEHTVQKIKNTYQSLFTCMFLVQIWSFEAGLSLHCPNYPWWRNFMTILLNVTPMLKSGLSIELSNSCSNAFLWKERQRWRTQHKNLSFISHLQYG